MTQMTKKQDKNSEEWQNWRKKTGQKQDKNDEKTGQ